MNVLSHPGAMAGGATTLWSSTDYHEERIKVVVGPAREKKDNICPLSSEPRLYAPLSFSRTTRQLIILLPQPFSSFTFSVDHSKRSSGDRKPIPRSISVGISLILGVFFESPPEAPQRMDVKGSMREALLALLEAKLASGTSMFWYMPRGVLDRIKSRGTELRRQAARMVIACGTTSVMKSPYQFPEPQFE